MIIGDNIFAMFLTEEFFKTFTEKRICDTATTVEVFNVLAVDSREEVDQLITKALTAGGTEPRPPQDEGWYARAFQDLDGHDWEVFHMEPAAS